MKHWFSDGALRTMIRNTAFLGSSNVVSALLGLLALSCAGKGMSPEMFGSLVVIQSYAKAISDFIKFQTWQFVVQYGTPALASNNLQRFSDVVSFSFGLDITSGVVAVLGGMLLLPFLSHSLGLGANDFWFAMLYCTLIPSMAASTPTGILRALDRFDLIAIQQATKPFLRAIGSVIAYFGDYGFAGFIITWYASNLIGGTMYWWFAARELRRINIHGALRPRLFNVAQRIEGAWNFVWTTNIAHSIWSARNTCSTVFVGIILGPAAAGLFKIAMTFFDVTGTPAKLLEKSFYPEIMRLDPRTKKPWLLGLRSALLAGTLGMLVALAVVVIGKPLISLVFGYKYLMAYNLILIMLSAIVVSMLGFPQESLLFMAGKQRAFLAAQSIASVCYITLLIALSHFFGVSGAAFAYLGGQCLDVLLSLIPTLRAYNNRHLLNLRVPEGVVND
ncbi:lipopolysaccharide biosynthesis protein [Erwinia sorbitola]|uniref:Oligosaccharide flippase family protein n=1 Tax=Erwinia sorbitola TaxID=2681984 RepID=A0A6I6EBY7_9GAMM|nr:lipopolysaccharide biosynthesis protein [Erwinia sorbitola]MTD26192.1 oligosaccharide flippase family protein [Erwinia sorbitola]QGU87274.1 oligosaccharide flippase family protein [Erwinia sorbitola]